MTIAMLSTRCDRVSLAYSTMSGCPDWSWTSAHMPLCNALQVLDEDGSRYIELPEFAKLYQDQVRPCPEVHRICISQLLHMLLALCCFRIHDNRSLDDLCLWLQLKKPDSVLTP